MSLCFSLHFARCFSQTREDSECYVFAFLNLFIYLFIYVLMYDDMECCLPAKDQGRWKQFPICRGIGRRLTAQKRIHRETESKQMKT